MKLSRNLFYTLIAIFSLGVILTCTTESASIWSRIATGLITGSFVGIINALVNYLHQRKEFCERVSKVMVELSLDAVEDFTKFEVRLDSLMKDDKRHIIEEDHKGMEDNFAIVRKFGEKYESYYFRLDSSAYVPLFFFKNKVVRSLEELEDIVWDIHTSEAYLHCCFGFGLLAVKASKKEQMMAIGDPDVFYKETMQNNVDFRDIFVYNISELSKAYEAVGKSFSGIVDKNAIPWPAIVRHLSNMIEGYEVKDVMSLRGEEAERELEEKICSDKARA